jgi:hypothetical protein
MDNGSKSFRDWHSEYECLRSRFRGGEIGVFHFVQSTYEFLAAMERSGDPRIRFIMIEQMERDIREAYKPRLS